MLFSENLNMSIEQSNTRLGGCGTGDVMFIHGCDLLNVKKHSARPALLPISPRIIYYEPPLDILFLLLLVYCLFY